MAASDDQLYEWNNASLLKSIREAQKGINEFEKGVVGGAGRAGAALGDMEARLVVATSKGEKAQQAQIRSLEKTAAAYGQSLTQYQKLQVAHDAMTKRIREQDAGLGTLESKLSKVNALYAKMYEQAKKADAEAAKGAGGGGGMSGNLAFRAARDFFEGRTAFAEVQGGKFLQSLSGLPQVLGIASAAFVGFGIAAYKSAESLAEYGVRIREVQERTGFSAKEVAQFGFAAKLSGQDVSIFERGMRGLTAAIEDQSPATDKAKALLTSFGIDLRGVRDGTISTAEVYEKLATGLEGINNPLERAHARMEILKRAGTEMAPVLDHLTERLNIAREAGWGASEAELKRFDEYNKNLKTAAENWGEVTRGLKEYLVQFAIFMLGGKQGPGGKPFEVSALEWAGGAASAVGGFLSRGNEKTLAFLGGINPFNLSVSPLRSRVGMDVYDPYTVQVGVQAGRRRYDESAQSAYFSGQGAEGRLKRAEEELSAMPRITKLSTAEEVAARTSKEALVTQLKEEVKANEKLKSVLEEINKLKTQEALRAGESIRLLPSQRDYNAMATRAIDVGHPELLPGVAKTLEPRFNRENKERLDKLLTENRATTDRYAKEEQASTVRHTEDVLKTFQHQQLEQDRLLKEGIKIRRDTLEEENKHELRMAEAEARTYSIRNPTARGRALSESYMLEARKKSADQTRDYEEIIAKESYEDRGDREAAIFRVRMKYVETIAEAEAKYDEQRYQAEQAQIEGLKRHAESLFTTLFTHPSKFGQQLGSTLQAAALAPITGGLSDLTARALRPLVYGATGTTGLSGMFSGLFGGGGGSVGRLGGGGTGGGTGGGGGFAGAGSVGAGFAGLGSSLGAASSLGMSALSALNVMGQFGGGGGGGGGGMGTAGRTGGGGASILSGTAGRFGGLFKGLKGDWMTPSRDSGAGGPGGLGQGDYGGETDNPAGTGALNKGTFEDFLTSKNASGLLLAGGMPLANAGIFGSHRGTFGGTAMSTLGGAMVGASIGNTIAPGGTGLVLGAAIGAGAGLGIGIGEQIAGVEPQWKEAERLVRQNYHINIDQHTGQKIADIANSSYAGHVSVAVMSPEVRKMMGLYAAGTGQAGSFPQSATSPHGASLVEAGGQLQQESVYQYGNPYTYQSSLPTYGGGGSGSLPNPGGPTYVSMNVSGAGLAPFMTGQYVTPTFIQSQNNNAWNASAGRVNDALMMSEPGTVV